MDTVYEDAVVGEWYTPIKRGFLNKCCGCGLVHVIDFRLKGGEIQLKFTDVFEEPQPVVAQPEEDTIDTIPVSC